MHLYDPFLNDTNIQEKEEWHKSRTQNISTNTKVWMTDAEERKNLINITNFILHSKLLLLTFILGLNRPNKRVGGHNVNPSEYRSSKR